MSLKEENRSLVRAAVELLARNGIAMSGTTIGDGKWKIGVSGRFQGERLVEIETEEERVALVREAEKILSSENAPGPLRNVPKEFLYCSVAEFSHA